MASANLKLLNDVKNGFTEIKPYVIKHPQLKESLSFDLYYDRFFSLAKKRGVLTNEEALVRAHSEKSWTNDNQREFDSINSYLKVLSSNYEKASENSKKYLLNDIEDAKKKISSMLSKRTAAVGKTAEFWGNKMANERFVASLFYNSTDLSVRTYSDEEIESLEEEEIDLLYKAYLSFIQSSCEHELKSLAISPYCQNIFTISQDPYHFFGRAVLEMTSLQQSLILFIQRYKSLISAIAGKVPDKIITDYQELEKWGQMTEKEREVFENSIAKSSVSYEAIRRASVVDQNQSREDSAAHLKKMLS